MCIRDRPRIGPAAVVGVAHRVARTTEVDGLSARQLDDHDAVSYTHLRAHETVLDLVCRLLLEHKKYNDDHIHAE